MLMAINQQGEQVYAHRAKQQDSYFCPHCRSQLLLKRGIKKMPHFAHKVDSVSYCAKQESEQHYFVKSFIAKKLSQQHYHVQIEPYCPTIQQFPDILVNLKFVIEIQFSRISIEEILERTKGFKQLNMEVIWLIKDCRYHRGRLYLNSFQAHFIHPINRCLYVWNHENKRIVLYSQIQHIGGKQFIAKQTVIEINELVNQINIMSPPYQHIFKLKKSEIHHYLNQCRRQNSVIEPSLSAMYQLRLSDEAVYRNFGYIFPYQLYIENHPVQWQLQLELLNQQERDVHQCLKDFLKFRQMYLNTISMDHVVSELINHYRKYS
ncbi:competence protein CoiA family protein [Staphylococcus borealis]|uniref:competence protein CoiA n=1 Tax=Staphylococcus borealis TaxID=2742203 RepID=UPI002A80F3F1|nr:competence protein CoiA family protein [Staphylococcus borealis]MDY4022276.1 competence protein CoiA family protein [Staphylococcus borealis]